MVPLECNVHGWMHAYLGVLDHPYFAVSGADGTFTIEGGDGTAYETVFMTDLSDATSHIAHSYTAIGLYRFMALCSHLRFILDSATNADLDATLFPSARP